MKEKSMMDAHCRLLTDANELTKKAAKFVTTVGIVNGISATFSADVRGEDAHDWEADLAETLVEAAKSLGKANDEIHKAIEIVMENEGADDENGGADDEDRS